MNLAFLIVPAASAAIALPLFFRPGGPRHPMGHEGRPTPRAMVPPPMVITEGPGIAPVAQASTGGPAQGSTRDEDGTLRLTFKELASSTRDAQEKHQFPDAIRAADGKTVRIRGFMVPYDSLEDMSVFMLMQVSNGCFFCEPPSLNQVVIVHQKPGGSKKFVEDPMEVTGTFRVWSEGSKHPDHESGFVYVLDDATYAKAKISNEEFVPAKPDAHRPSGSP